MGAKSNPIGEWNASVKIRNWFERLEVVFMDEGYKEPADDKTMVIKLIRWIGDEGYDQLKTLSAPVTPLDSKYKDLKNALIDSLDPSPTTISQRFRFYRMKQGTRTASQWKSELIYQASFCDFGNHTKEAIRDQFVFGLACEETRITLMETEDLTLEKAFSRVDLRERAHRDNKFLTHGGTSSRASSEASEVNEVTTGYQSKRRREEPLASKGRAAANHPGGTSLTSGKHGNGKVCVRCKLAVSANKCTETRCNTKCFHCKISGHSKAQCRKLKSSCSHLDEIDCNSQNSCECDYNWESDLNFIEIHRVNSMNDKVFINCHLNSKCVKFELDTGSALTCLNESTFNKYFPGLRLKPARHMLKVANGTTVDKVQVCNVDMSFRNKQFDQVELHVVSDPFPALLGRDWISLIWGKDWASNLIARAGEPPGAEVDVLGIQGRTKVSSDVRVLCKGTESRAVPGSTKVQDCRVAETRAAVQGTNCLPAENRAVELDREQGYVLRFYQGSTEDQTDSKVVCQSQVSETSRGERLAKIRESKVFEPGIGEVVGFEACLQLKEDQKPVFRKARTVPYALKEKIEAKLDKMVDDGILAPVDSSQYASPIVPVEKDDGTVRICGDYKSTLNPNLETKQYPLPTVEECFQPMHGGKKFSKLDISQAYNNVKLRQSDQKLTTINTTKGLFVWTRLPFGISSSTAIFQQKMDQDLRGCKGTVCRVDDILMTGLTEEEHLSNLEEVVKRLEKSGFRCNLKKSLFLQDEVKYLGYIINQKGIRPCEDKVATLLKAEYPENLNALMSFLGAVNYYGRFLRNLSTMVEPLNRLRRGVPWRFGVEEKAAFDNLKKALASPAVIVPYDPKLPVKIDTDASSSGIGAVISHIMEDGTERPIEFASRTLSSAERNYSQIEKEALSLVWGVKKFHKFVYAREFTLITDHKPLLFILKEDKAIPEMGASRILRWAVTLSSYQYKIQYRPTEKHANADVCSRFPLKTQEAEPDREVSEVLFNNFLDKPVINFNSIRKFTGKDVILCKVRKLVREGWPSRLAEDQVYLKPYFDRRTELSLEKDCVLWGTRVVVPEDLQKDVLKLLHICHQGVVAVKSIARSFVWWPKINEQIEMMTRLCKACQDSQNKAAKSKPHPWTPAKRPWERIHADFCGPVEGKMYLVVVDAYSRWPEVVNMRSCTTSGATIKELRKMFARFGLPEYFSSDNGPQLVSDEMESFLKANGISRIPIPTYSPNTNGLAERSVQTFKKAMEKGRRDGTDLETCLSRWLLHFRNTPNATTNQTPAVMMVGRPTRTLLSLLDPLTNPQEKEALDPNERLRSFRAGDRVRILDVRSEEWYPGIVAGQEGSKVYLVKSQKRGLERRHLDHLIRAFDLVELPSCDPVVQHECKDQSLHNPVVVSKEHFPAVPKPNFLIEPRPQVQTEVITEESSKLPSPPPVPTVVERRVSARQRSQVDKLQYSKLGG